MNEKSVVIDKNHPLINFGQTVEVVGFDEFSDECIVVADGDKNRYRAHYTSLWPLNRICEYLKLNEAITSLE
jgi:hypothetical protein